MLIIVEPLLVCVPMEILNTLAKAFIFTNKWFVAQGLYWNMGASLLSFLSSSQHYLQGLHKVSNNLAKSVCEVSDTVYLHSLTNKLHLWYWLPLKHISCDNILQFVTDVVQRMGGFGKLIQYAMPILSSIPSCITPSMCFEPLSFSLLPCCFSGYISFPEI